VSRERTQGARARAAPRPRPPRRTLKAPRAPPPRRRNPKTKNQQELLAIQNNDGPKSIALFGSRNMGLTHQQLVEVLACALVAAVRFFFFFFFF
jgi:hypothetical protein